MLKRLRDAQNAHDAKGMAALFAEDYASSQPLHAGRAFVRGVTIFVVRGDLIVEGRLYMEPVDTANEDIEAAVQELYKPPPAETA
jgi:hypothetical protein